MDRTSAAAVAIELLADRPDLVASLADIRWREWGDEPGREDLQWWIDTALRESGRTALPAAFVAVDPTGQPVGGVSLAPSDLPERADRGPWVVGTIVRPDRRGLGIGTVLIAELKRWAARAGIDQLWVATGGHAVDFYRGCGFTVTEVLTRNDGEQATILTARLTG